MKTVGIVILVVAALLIVYGIYRVFWFVPLRIAASKDKQPGEHHLPGYNYCGSNTKSNGEKPVNELDACCQQHDQDYGNKMNRLEADRKLFHCFDQKTQRNPELLDHANLMKDAMEWKNALL